MKKKMKGFTLIELLAVIIILAIILLIIVPIVLDVIDEASRGAFESSGRGYAKTAENECLTTMVEDAVEPRQLEYFDYEPVGSEKLNFSGEAPLYGDIRISETCKVALAVHNGEWCVTKHYDERDVRSTDDPWEECEIPEFARPEPGTRHLTVNITGQGSASPREGMHVVNEDQTVTILPTPAPGWGFVGFIGDCTGSECELFMDESKDVTLIFQPTFNLTIEINGNGTTTPTAGTHTYPLNDEVNVIPTPSAGWRLANFAGDCSGGSCTVVMSQNRNVTVNFEEIPTYTLTININGSGSSSPAAGVHTYEEGQSVSITPNPASGWSFEEFSGACSGSTCNVSMTQNKTVTLTFLWGTTCGGGIGDSVTLAGYTYGVTQLGDQCWFTEDLRQDFNDCTENTWTNGILTTADACRTSQNGLGETIMLYQWHAAMGGSTTEGAQGACPAGWRIPTDADWLTLEETLGMSLSERQKNQVNNGGPHDPWPHGSSDFGRGAPVGNMLKIDPSEQSWCSGSTDCATTRFSANTTGNRPAAGGDVINRLYGANYWTSTQTEAHTEGTHTFYLVAGRAITYNNTGVHRSWQVSDAGGYAVRCVRDIP